MIIDSLVEKGVIPPKYDTKGHPVATESQLRAWVNLVSPFYHLGQPYPLETAQGWVVPEYLKTFIWDGRQFLKEGEALIAMLEWLLIPRNPAQTACPVIDPVQINELTATTPAVQNKKEWLVGIDTSVTNCAAALYCTTSRRLLWLGTFDAFGLIRFLEAIPAYKRPAVGVVVEDPNIESATFAVLHSQKDMTMARAAAMGQDAGKAMGIARAVIQALQTMGIDYTVVNPALRTSIANIEKKGDIKGFVIPQSGHYLPTKTNANYFQKLTGWADKSNEHERDAATLVFGRTWDVITVRAQIDNQPKRFGAGAKKTPTKRSFKFKKR
jgi:hypothetical protein